jgi:hypothetical protein
MVYIKTAANGGHVAGGDVRRLISNEKMAQNAIDALINFVPSRFDKTKAAAFMLTPVMELDGEEIDDTAADKLHDGLRNACMVQSLT